MRKDAHTHEKDIILCYLDLKDAFPSTKHRHLVRVLEYLGLPHDFTPLVSSLYREASTEFITPYGHRPAVGNKRDTLQGDPLSPLLLDLMIEALIRWIRASNKGYDIASSLVKRVRLQRPTYGLN